MKDIVNKLVVLFIKVVNNSIWSKLNQLNYVLKVIPYKNELMLNASIISKYRERMILISRLLYMNCFCKMHDRKS